MLLNVTVQKVALGPLHFDDREPVGANLNALLEKLKIDIIGQAHLAKMFGDRLITFGMVADRAQEAANCPGLLECQKPAKGFCRTRIKRGYPRARSVRYSQAAHRRERHGLEC